MTTKDTRTAMASHVLRVHGMSMAQVEGRPEPYACPEPGCDFKTSRPQGLGAHRRAAHGTPGGGGSGRGVFGGLVNRRSRARASASLGGRGGQLFGAPIYGGPFCIPHSHLGWLRIRPERSPARHARRFPNPAGVSPGSAMPPGHRWSHTDGRAVLFGYRWGPKKAENGRGPHHA